MISARTFTVDLEKDCAGHDRGCAGPGDVMTAAGAVPDPSMPDAASYWNTF
jgi:hypothetical protein